MIGFDKLQIGMNEFIEYDVTDKKIKAFAEVSGDYNPIHINECYASNSRYKKRIAHGFMSSSLFSGIFGTKLPGIGSIYVSQTLFFRRPVYIGDTVKVLVEVIRLNQEKKKVYFKTECIVNKKVVIHGEAEIYIP